MQARSLAINMQRLNWFLFPDTPTRSNCCSCACLCYVIVLAAVAALIAAFLPQLLTTRTCLLDFSTVLENDYELAKYLV